MDHNEEVEVSDVKPTSIEDNHSKYLQGEQSMSGSIVMRRILGLEKKKRIQRSVQIEIELYQTIKKI